LNKRSWLSDVQNLKWVLSRTVILERRVVTIEDIDLKTLLLAELKSTCDFYLTTLVAVATLINISRSRYFNFSNLSIPSTCICDTTNLSMPPRIQQSFSLIILIHDRLKVPFWAILSFRIPVSRSQVLPIQFQLYTLRSVSQSFTSIQFVTIWSPLRAP
jgi:hypothetical protein